MQPLPLRWWCPIEGQGEAVTPLVAGWFNDE